MGGIGAAPLTRGERRTGAGGGETGSACVWEGEQDPSPDLVRLPLTWAPTVMVPISPSSSALKGQSSTGLTLQREGKGGCADLTRGAVGPPHITRVFCPSFFPQAMALKQSDNVDLLSLYLPTG